MAQSPQVIIDDSGTRWLQAMLAGSQAFGQGLGKLGEALGSLRERQKQWKIEDEVKRKIKQYGVYASSIDKDTPADEVSSSKKGFLVNLLSDTEHPEAAMMAFKIIQEADPTVSGSLAIQQEISKRQEDRFGHDLLKFQEKMGESQRRLDLLEEAEARRREDSFNKKKATDLANKTFANSNQLMVAMAQIKSLPIEQQYDALKDMPATISGGGPLLFDNSSLRDWAKATESALNKDSEFKESSLRRQFALLSAEETLNRLNAILSADEVSPSLAMAAIKVAGETLGQNNAEQEGYIHLVGAMNYAIRAIANEGKPKAERTGQGATYSADDILDVILGPSGERTPEDIRVQQSFEHLSSQTGVADEVQRTAFKVIQERIAGLLSAPAVTQSMLGGMTMAPTDLGSPIMKKFGNFSAGMRPFIDTLVKRYMERKK